MSRWRRERADAVPLLTTGPPGSTEPRAAVSDGASGPAGSEHCDGTGGSEHHKGEPVRQPLPLPQPPLVHPILGFSLRPWGSTSADAAALVAAWADPEVVLWTEVPKSRGRLGAERWIAGEERRRTSGKALDLVLSELGAPEHVWGEVGLVVVEPERGWAEIGYWLTPEARGQGRATAGVSLVAEWALRILPVNRLFARTHPDNTAGAAVAERARFTSAGILPDGTAVWALDG